MSNIKSRRITQDGYRQLIDRRSFLLKDLESSKIALSNARQLGDLKENADYTATRNHIRHVNDELSALETKIETAIVVENSNNDGTIGFGSRFIGKSNFLDATEFRVVGEMEANLLNGLISEENEIGRSLIGKKAGDKVVIRNGCEINIIEILK